MLISIVVVCYIQRFQSERVKNFILGRNNRNPVLNLIAIILGHTIHNLPRGSFARYLLMMTILFYFVNRTMYQGYLFEFLQSNAREPEVASIQEMIKKDFKFYMVPSAQENARNIEEIFKRKVLINVSEVDDYVARTTNPLFKGAYLASKDSALYYNNEVRQNFTLKICKEILFNRQFGIYFQKNTFLREIFDEMLHKLLQHGFIEEWVSYYTVSDFDDFPPKEPRQIKLKELFGVFKLFLFGVVLSFSVFCLELLSRKYWVLKRLFE